MSGVSWILNILNNIIFWFQAIIFVIAVIMVLWAAYLYVTASGNSEKVGQATKTIIYAVIGIAVALLAFGIVPIVSSLLGGAASQFQYQYYQQQQQSYQQPYDKTPGTTLPYRY
ncbi:MAG: pilin [Patescibacteria group bacterium]